MDKPVKHYINYDPQTISIHSLVVDSLKNNYRDYVFSSKDKETVLEICKKQQISLVYIERYDKYGDLDYIEFIPVKFKNKKSKPSQINIKDINKNSKKWNYIDLSKRTQAFVIKGREPSSDDYKNN